MEVRYGWRWEGSHWHSWAMGTVPYVVIYPKVNEDGTVTFEMNIFTDAWAAYTRSTHKRLGDAIGDAQGFITSDV